MDTPQTKKEDIEIGSIQVNTMPSSLYGMTPKANVPASPQSNPAPKPIDTAPLGSSVATTTLGQVPAVQMSANIKPVSSQQSEQDKKPVKKNVIFIVAILLLLILGGGAYWFFAYGQAMLMTRQMVLKFESPYQNYVSNFELVMDARQQKNNSENTMDNPVEMFLPASDNIKIDMKGLVHVVDKNFDGNFQFNVDAAGFSLKNGMDYKQIDQNVYFKFKEDFLSELLGGFGLDLSEFFYPDRWLTFNYDEIKKVADEQLDTAINADIYDKDKQSEQNQKINDYLAQFKIADIFKIVDTKEVKESKDGQLKKFQLIIKPNKVNDLSIMLSIFDPTYLGDTDLKNPQEIKEKITQDINKKIADDPDGFASFEGLVQAPDFYIWFNTKTKVFQGASLVWDADVVGIDGDEAVLTGHFDFSYEAEEAFVIDKPAQTITIMQAYENTMKKMAEERLETMKQYEEQNNKDSDSDGLTDVMEGFYGSDVLKPDTDGDGFKDGEEVDNGYSPVGPGKLDLGAIRS